MYVLSMALLLIVLFHVVYIVCLDGSSPGYHLQKGFGSGSNNWLLHIEVTPFTIDFSSILLIISGCVWVSFMALFHRGEAYISFMVIIINCSF